LLTAARAAEARWQQVWDERGIFATGNDDPRPMAAGYRVMCL